MSEVCELLKRSLELYAEDELGDARAVRRIRRHLEACPACRRFLAAYDARTREVIIEAGAGGWEPAFWEHSAMSRGVLEAVDGLPPPRKAPSGSRFPAGTALAAAALILSLQLLWWLGGGAEAPQADPASSGVEVAGAAGRGVERDVRADFPPLGDILWVRGSEVEAARVLGRGSSAGSERIWLVGPAGHRRAAGGPFDGGGRARDGVRAELLALEVRVVAPGAGAGLSRLLLVPEDLLRREQRDETAPAVAVEVLPRELCKVPAMPLSSAFEGAGVPEGAAAPRRYRVIPVGSGALEPGALPFRAAAPAVLEWLTDRRREKGPFGSLSESAFLPSGPRS